LRTPINGNLETDRRGPSLDMKPKTAGYGFSPIVPLFGGKKVDITDRDYVLEGCRAEQMREIQEI
jgi:hypothetical protein